nr:hypothetical protein Iba_chr02fCG1620 [Ipomoea batatas]
MLLSEDEQRESKPKLSQVRRNSGGENGAFAGERSFSKALTKCKTRPELGSATFTLASFNRPSSDPCFSAPLIGKQLSDPSEAAGVRLRLRLRLFEADFCAGGEATTAWNFEPDFCVEGEATLGLFDAILWALIADFLIDGEPDTFKPGFATLGSKFSALASWLTTPPDSPLASIELSREVIRSIPENCETSAVQRVFRMVSDTE